MGDSAYGTTVGKRRLGAFYGAIEIKAPDSLLLVRRRRIFERSQNPALAPQPQEQACRVRDT